MGTKGIITSWNDDKGFGFIKPSTGKKKIFVHIKSFSNRNRRPEINELVFYSESTDNLGRPRAVNVEFAGDNNSKSKRKNSGSTSVFIAIFFLLIVGASVFFNQKFFTSNAQQRRI